MSHIEEYFSGISCQSDQNHSSGHKWQEMFYEQWLLSFDGSSVML